LWAFDFFSLPRTWICRWFYFFISFQYCNFSWAKRLRLYDLVRFHSGFIKHAIDSIFWQQIKHQNSSLFLKSLFILFFKS
jgi:hypothetical protein